MNQSFTYKILIIIYYNDWRECLKSDHIAWCSGGQFFGTDPPQEAEFIMQITGDPNPLDRPLSVDVDREGDIFAADISRGDVQVFDRDGEFIMK